MNFSIYILLVLLGLSVPSYADSHHGSASSWFWGNGESESETANTEGTAVAPMPQVKEKPTPTEPWSNLLGDARSFDDVVKSAKKFEEEKKSYSEGNLTDDKDFKKQVEEIRKATDKLSSADIDKLREEAKQNITDPTDREAALKFLADVENLRGLGKLEELAKSALSGDFSKIADSLEKPSLPTAPAPKHKSGVDAVNDLFKQSNTYTAQEGMGGAAAPPTTTPSEANSFLNSTIDGLRHWAGEHLPSPLAEYVKPAEVADELPPLDRPLSSPSFSEVPHVSEGPSSLSTGGGTTSPIAPVIQEAPSTGGHATLTPVAPVAPVEPVNPVKPPDSNASNALVNAGIGGGAPTAPTSPPASAPGAPAGALQSATSTPPSVPGTGSTGRTSVASSDTGNPNSVSNPGRRLGPVDDSEALVTRPPSRLITATLSNDAAPNAGAEGGAGEPKGDTANSLKSLLSKLLGDAVEPPVAAVRPRSEGLRGIDPKIAGQNYVAQGAETGDLAKSLAAASSSSGYSALQEAWASLEKAAANSQASSNPSGKTRAPTSIAVAMPEGEANAASFSEVRPDYSAAAASMPEKKVASLAIREKELGDPLRADKVDAPMNALRPQQLNAKKKATATAAASFSKDPFFGTYKPPTGIDIVRAARNSAFALATPKGPLAGM